MAFFITYYIVVCLSAFIFSAVGTGVAWRFLRFSRILDIPNERSNHKEPIPRGAGIAVVFSVVSFMMVSGADGGLLLAALLLAVVSFMDDWKGVKPQHRLLTQLIAVVMALDAIQGQVFQNVVHPWLDMAIAGVLWIWFTNLTNFMDGIDGITAGEVISICIGLILLYSSVPDLPRDVLIDASVIAAATFGFALWNWHPAKVFLGDVGSIPLGFLIGYLLLLTAEAGYWQAAVILPAYYITDASLTLLRRLLRGEKIWESHSEHAYQQAARSGRPHDAIVRDMLALNMILIVLAVVSTLGKMAGLVSIGVAYLLCLAFVNHLKSTPRHHFHGPVPSVQP